MDHEKKQTAVYWFIKELIKEGYYIPKGIGEQAKEMEKQQIIDFHVNCMEDGYNIETDKLLTEDLKLDIKTHAEQYYEETFK